MGLEQESTVESNVSFEASRKPEPDKKQKLKQMEIKFSRILDNSSEGRDIPEKELTGQVPEDNTKDNIKKKKS